MTLSKLSSNKLLHSGTKKTPFIGRNKKWGTRHFLAILPLFMYLFKKRSMLVPLCTMEKIAPSIMNLLSSLC